MRFYEERLKENYLKSAISKSTFTEPLFPFAETMSNFMSVLGGRREGKLNSLLREYEVPTESFSFVLNTLPNSLVFNFKV